MIRGCIFNWFWGWRRIGFFRGSDRIIWCFIWWICRYRIWRDLIVMWCYWWWIWIVIRFILGGFCIRLLFCRMGEGDLLYSGWRDCSRFHCGFILRGFWLLWSILNIYMIVYFISGFVFVINGVFMWIRGCLLNGFF
jgi:hypothetical protein